MTLEEIWRGKSDDELLAAAQRLADYTEVGQRVIVAEIERRGGLGEIREMLADEESPVAADSTGTDVPRGYLRRLWRGHVSLPITYWVWGVGGVLAWPVLVAVAEANNALALSTFLATLGLAYYAFICVAIWRSAGQFRGRRIWAELARISIAVRVAGLVVSVFFRR